MVDFLKNSAILFLFIFLIRIVIDFWKVMPSDKESKKEESINIGEYMKTMLTHSVYIFLVIVIVGTVIGFLGGFVPVIQKKVLSIQPIKDLSHLTAIWAVILVILLMIYKIVKNKVLPKSDSVEEIPQEKERAVKRVVFNKNAHLKAILPIMESAPITKGIPQATLKSSFNKALKHIGVIKLEEPDLEVIKAESTFGANIFVLDTSKIVGLTLNKLNVKKDEIQNFLGWDGLRFERGESAGLVRVIIPLKQRQRILLRDLIEDETFQSISSNQYPVPLGRTLTGELACAELANHITPHFLIGGGTGSGKSFLVNCLIFTFLSSYSPEDFLLAVIDPKGSEFLSFKSFPHIIEYVDNDFEKQLRLVAWAENEMNRRNIELFAKDGVKNLSQWNARHPDKKLPRILLVIDEYADIVTDKGQKKKFEPIVSRLAAKARSSGIHLMLIMQKPSVEVIDSTLRSNLGCRIALRMTDVYCYKTLLSNYDGTTLMGKGDMLVEFADEQHRLQGGCLTQGNEEDEERLITKALNYWKSKKLETSSIDVSSFDMGTNESQDETSGIELEGDDIEDDSPYPILKNYIAELVLSMESNEEPILLPTVRTLESVLKINRNAVSRTIKKLTMEEWIIKEGNTSRGSRYIVNINNSELQAFVCELAKTN